MKKIINVLIVDDCKVTTQLLRAILATEPSIQVVGCAGDGLSAVSLTKQLKPDIITMDIFMPKMDGIEATETIMSQCPTPIIVFSSHTNNKESELAFNALQAGALTIIEKPSVSGDGFDKIKQQIINTIRTLAEVRVVARHPIKPPAISYPTKSGTIEILAIGSSTGGPGALDSIFSSLPANFPLPIVVTQHITDGFLSGLINWLQRSSALHMEIATNNQKLLAGHVYFAENNIHLTVQQHNGPVAVFDDSEPVDHFKPSVNVLFASIAKNFPGSSIGGLLTGMGKDGAAGLLQMKQAGCLTFAQSEATCAVYGMPSAAAALQATDQLIDLEKIPQLLATLIEKGRSL